MESWSLSFNANRLSPVEPVAAAKALGSTPLPMNFDPTTKVGQGQSSAARLRRLELDASNPALAKARFRSDARAMRQRLASQVEGPLYQGWRDALGELASLAKAREGGVGEAQLRQVAERAAELLGQLNVATGQKGLIREDALAQDLRDALAAQFKPSSQGQARSLGDLGFGLDAQGEVQVDAERLKAAFAPLEGGTAPAAEQVLSNSVFLLASAGAKAIIDALQQAPMESRLAEQNVRARAEVTRLESRQRQLLVFDAFVQNQRTRIKAMAERLEKDEKAEDGPAWPVGAKASPPAQPKGPAGPLGRLAEDPMGASGRGFAASP